MSDYLDPNNEELLKDFFMEANLQVDTLEQNILVLENDPGNRDSVDEIFRAAHTLKGGSATVQMTELAEFTHVVEDVLDGIRSDEVSVDTGVVDTLLESIDIIKAMLAARADSSVYDEPVDDIKEHLESLLPGNGGKAPAKRRLRLLRRPKCSLLRRTPPVKGFPSMISWNYRKLRSCRKMCMRSSFILTPIIR